MGDYISGFEILVDGSPLETEMIDDVTEIVVDQHTHLPAMATVRLYDPDFKHIDTGSLDLTRELEISFDTQDDSKVTVFKGEITSLEPEWGEGMVAELVVRAYDKAHRLYREAKSQAFLNIKDSDLASRFAGNAGLSAQVESTNTVYEAIFQDNQTDLAFLMQRAWRIGYECFVSDSKLYFRKPKPSEAGPILTYGENLLSFRMRATLAEQVDEVFVKGWDPATQQAIVGQASNGALYPQIGEAKNGQSWAGIFGAGKRTIVDHPVISQAEANIIAQARMDEISGAFIEAEGVAYRCPDIVAGKNVEIKDLGQRFSGKYLVTQANHRWTHEGLMSTFQVRGSRTGTLVEQSQLNAPVQKWSGVVPAIVTNTDDPNDWGRVKVKYPWMADDADSWWARVIGAGAGPNSGFCLVPEVNDEVIVAFEHGDFNSPIILGGLWNGRSAIPPAVAGAAAGDKPLVRVWQSIKGNYIAMHDDADQKIEIMTTGGHVLTFDDNNKKVELKTSAGHTITLDDQNKKVEAKSAGGHKVTMDDMGRAMTVESAGNLNIKAAMNVKIEGVMIDVTASGMLNLKGSIVNIN